MIMRILSFIFITMVCISAEDQQGPSPDSEFLVQPSNVTVPVGELVVMKCVVASKAEICRWYYLEKGLKFFDKRVTPMLVKEFTPAGREDCSIIIKKAKKVQEGQWLCQALKFMSAKFIMSKPASLTVITEAESATWVPPKEDPTPRGARREDGPEDQLQFDTSNEDVIQDVFIHEKGVLKCQVNQPIQSCRWMMPGGLNISVSSGKTYEETQEGYEQYQITGDLDEGNCSLEISEVAYHNEGNWRCVVRTARSTKDFQGPLIHLHILDQNSASKHTHDVTTLGEDNDDSINFLVISLVTISGILFVIVLMLLMFLYKRLKGPSDERQRILPNSPRNSVDLSRKMIPATDLTAASVVAVEPRKKLPFYEDHYGHYNQYLDMSGSSGMSYGDGYVMMPGSSIRSSTSSRTTLSTLSTLPIGRSRSASNSTTDSSVFPHLTTIIDNPSYSPDIANKRHSRPDSVYSNDHIYEEIKEKIDEIVSKMEKIPEVESPTYINTTEDCEGYMIPKKSPTEISSDQEKKDNLVHITKTPLPDPKTKDDSKELSKTDDSTDQDDLPPPYSTVSDNGLVPLVSNPQQPLSPGYSRVGNDPQIIVTDPMERYDVPRPIPTNPTDSYDVPPQRPIPVNQPPIDQVETEVALDGLSGIIV